MHACGHDFHDCLAWHPLHAGVTQEQLSGTIIAVTQPAEEVGAGTQVR